MSSIVKDILQTSGAVEMTMPKPIRSARSFALALVALAGFALPAAAIDCKDGYQLVQGNYLSTPYCQDALLTRVAHQYGINVTALEIRENPNSKRRVCRLVGRDIRVHDACITVNPSGRGRAY
jgi:hypothetical protein